MRCPYCESTKSLLVGHVFCSRHAHADMNALRSGTLYIKTKRLEETADHVSRLSIRLMLNGRQWYKVDGGDRLVHRDNFLVIDQGQHYRTAFSGERDLEMLMVGFRPGSAQEVARSLTLGHEQLLDEPCRDTEGPVFAAQTYTMDPVIRALFSQLHVLVQTGVEDHASDDIEVIHDRLMERLIGLQSGVRLNMERLDLVRRATRVEIWKRLTIAREYAEAHHAHALSVADLARVACLSPHHFKRLFREVYGVPPHRFLRQVRLMHARHLLSDGDRPVHEVALAVGFKDASAFSRVYRQVMGRAPRDEEH